MCFVFALPYITGNYDQASACQAHGAGHCGLAITPDGSKAYISFNLTDALMEINLANFSLSRCLNTSPAGIMLISGNVAAAPDGNRIFVANLGTRNVMAVNTSSGAVEAVLAIAPQWGDALKISSDGAELIVVTRSGSLALVNTSDYSYEAIDIPSVYLLAVVPSAANSNLLYCIGDFIGSGGNTFFTFNLTTRAIGQTAPLSAAALPASQAVRRLVVDTTEKTAYFGWLEFGAGDRGYGNLVGFDLTSFAVSAITDIDSGVHDLVLSESNGKVYTIGFWAGGASPNVLPISEWDTTSHTVVRQLNLTPASDLRAIAIDPVNPGYLYVTEGDNNYLARVNIASGDIVNKYSFFVERLKPRTIIAVDNTGYIISEDSSNVHKLNLTTGQLSGTFAIPTGCGSGGGYYQNHLYFSKDSNAIVKVDPSNGSLVESFSLSVDFNPINLTFFHNRMVALDYVPGTMIGRKFYVFDAATMQVLQSWDLPGEPHCDEVIVSPDMTKLYYSRGLMGREATITIVNSSTLEIEKVIDAPGHGGTSFSDAYFDQDNRRLYLAGFSSIYVIDMDTDELLEILDLKDVTEAMGREFVWTPTGLCTVIFSPDKSRLMTVAGDSNLVYT